MRILLISSYIFGYMDIAVSEMQRQGHEVEVLYYEEKPLNFRYKTLGYKLTSGIGKIFGKNAKKQFRETALKKSLKGKIFDYTLIIHGQYLNHATHKFLKSISGKYVAYFFDSLKKMPKQKEVAHHFDKVFSYEPLDCENEGYEFITNFIPSEQFRSVKFDYDVFNISAHDHRLSILQKLATHLKEKQISFRFILFSKKVKSLENFEITAQKININQIGEVMKKSKCIVDIQRREQKGLSFRPFEALGNHKKLITNNTDIKDYDFYNPSNILVINEKEIEIPKEFFETPYQQVPTKTYNQYTIESWVKKILS